MGDKDKLLNTGNTVCTPAKFNAELIDSVSEKTRCRVLSIMGTARQARHGAGIVLDELRRGVRAKNAEEGRVCFEALLCLYRRAMGIANILDVSAENVRAAQNRAADVRHAQAVL